LGWLSGGQLAGDAASFIFFILLSRQFGPEGIGIYAFAMAVASIGRTIAELGVEDYGVKELATGDSESAVNIVGRILGTQCWLAAMYVVGCIAFLFGVGASAREGVVVALLAVYHLSAGVVRSLFLPSFAKRRMAAPSLLEAGSRILAVAIGIGVLLGGGDTLVGVLAGFPICGGLLLAGGVWLNMQDLKGLRLQLELGSVISTAKQAWPYAAGTVASRLHERADVVMLSLIAGSTATGIYAAGLKFVEVSTIFVPLFAFALYPRLTQLAQEDADGFEIAVSTLIKGGLVACVLLGWIVFVFVPPLIPLFFGSQFQGAEVVVKLLTLWIPLHSVKILGDRLMLAAGRQVQRLHFQTIATGLNIAFNGVLIPILAIEGAIIASVVSAGVNAFLVIRYLQKFTSERLMSRLIAQTSPLFGAGLLAAAVFAYFETGEAWAAIAFVVSFLGATVVSGFNTMVWENASRLAQRDSP
jgi:O-antigen/teichoic acid export membrane protein